MYACTDIREERMYVYVRFNQSHCRDVGFNFFIAMTGPRYYFSKCSRDQIGRQSTVFT